jgi:hypothetical protein
VGSDLTASNLQTVVLAAPQMRCDVSDMRMMEQLNIHPQWCSRITRLVPISHGTPSCITRQSTFMFREINCVICARLV